MNPFDPPVGTASAAHAAVTAGSQLGGCVGVAVAVVAPFEVGAALPASAGVPEEHAVKPTIRAVPANDVRTVR
jgi:hypothetical protein